MRFLVANISLNGGDRNEAVVIDCVDAEFAMREHGIDGCHVYVVAEADARVGRKEAVPTVRELSAKEIDDLATEGG